MDDEGKRYEFRAYHEDAERTAVRRASIGPHGGTDSARTPEQVARHQIARMCAEDGRYLDPKTLRQTGSVAVVLVDSGRDYREVPEGEHDGHVFSWDATGYKGEPEELTTLMPVGRADGVLYYRLPGEHEVRVEHDMDGEPLAFTYKPDGTPASYLLAAYVNATTVQVMGLLLEADYLRLVPEPV